MVRGIPYHGGTRVIVSGAGRNATVHDPKTNAETQQSQEWTQICS